MYVSGSIKDTPPPLSQEFFSKATYLIQSINILWLTILGDVCTQYVLCSSFYH